MGEVGYRRVPQVWDRTGLMSKGRGASSLRHSSHSSGDLVDALTQRAGHSTRQHAEHVAQRWSSFLAWKEGGPCSHAQHLSASDLLTPCL